MKHTRVARFILAAWLTVGLLAALALSACTDDVGTRRHLEDAGYSDIEITGYRPLACSNDDGWKTGFRAHAVNGREVTGTFCQGVLKGGTIRVD